MFPIPPSLAWGRFETAISTLPVPYGSRCSLTGRVSPRLVSEWHAAPYLISSHHFTHPDFPLHVPRFPFPVSRLPLPPPASHALPAELGLSHPSSAPPRAPPGPLLQPRATQPWSRPPSGCHEQSLMCIHASGILHSAFCILQCIFSLQAPPLN